ncbi:hypothetical protein J7F03_03260 [Streptomyces sp. ISL-43]|nr:hypothetical protein [Streptomyces sp. ISL-43]MBT2446124.1 hypothetical protein [Streptomyces sp. ISL-43]
MPKIKTIVFALGLALATLFLASAPASACGKTVRIEGSGTGAIRINKIRY